MRNPFETAVRSEHQLNESAWVISRCCCLPLALAGPPEDVAEFPQAVAHFGQSGTAEVEKDVGIPTSDLRRPLIFWIAAVSTDYSQLWKTSGNLLQMKRSHSVRSYILRLVNSAA